MGKLHLPHDNRPFFPSFQWAVIKARCRFLALSPLGNPLRKALFPALKTVLQAPALRTFWGYEEEKAIAVKEFLGFVCGLCAAYSGIGEGHGGIASVEENYTPNSTPKSRGCPWTRTAEFEQSFSEISLIIKAFRTVLNSAAMKFGAGNEI